MSGPRSSQRERSLAPAAGVTPPPAEPSPHRFLSDVITERRLVEPHVMRAALQASLAGRSLTEILVGNGSLSEHDLAHTLAEHHGLDHVDLDVFDIDERATDLIDPSVARRLGALPIAFLPDDTVVVALYEPNGSTAAVELAHLTGRTIQPAVASRSQIEAVIRNLPMERRARIASGPAPSEPRGPVAEDRPPPPDPVANAAVQAAPPVERAAAPVAAPAAAVAPTAATIGAASLGAASLADQPADRLSLHFQGEVEMLHQRAEIAERRRGEAEERTAELQERVRAETTRADAAEQRAAAAEALVDEAEARCQAMAGSVASANDALARLLRACETIEREAQSHGPQVAALQAAHEETCAEQARREEALRADLETERDELARLEVRLLGELETERGERARLEVALQQARALDSPVSPAWSQRKLRRVKDPRPRGG